MCLLKFTFLCLPRDLLVFVGNLMETCFSSDFEFFEITKFELIRSSMVDIKSSSSLLNKFRL